MRMVFGLLPKFSTPVQKPVEISVLLRTEPKKLHNYGRFLKAKVRRARFEATFDGPLVLRTSFAVQP